MQKKCIAVAAVVLALAASMSLGTVAAWAVPPPPPTIDQMFPDPWTTGSARPGLIQGNMALGVERIDVYTSGTQLYCSTVADPAATVWFCDPAVSDLAVGVNQLSAVAVNGLNESSTPGATIEITRVVAPTITSHADGELTNDNTPDFAGTGTGSNFDLRDAGGVLCSGTVNAGAWACTPAPLADGDHEIFVDVAPAGDNQSPFQTLTIDTVAPALSQITAPAGPMDGPTMTASTTAAQPTITGTGELGATVELYQDYAPTGCTVPAVVGSSGTWSCSLSSPLTPGVYVFGSIQTDAAGNASTVGSPDEQLRLTVTAPPPAAVLPPPAATPHLPTTVVPAVVAWVLAFLADADSVFPGQSVTLTSTGLPPGAAVAVELHSTPVPLGSTVVGPDGIFTLASVIPDTVEPGDHHYVVTVTPTGEAPVTAKRPVSVMPAPVESPPEADGPDVEAQSAVIEKAAGTDAVVGDRNDPTTPNVLTDAVPTLYQLLANPVVLAVAGALSLALLLLVAIPAELLNSTLSSNTGRLGSFFARAERATDRVTARLVELFRTPAVPAALLVVLASIIFCFVDPAFGFDLASLRLLLSVGIGLFLLTYVASRLSGWIIRRAWNVESGIGMQPIGLVFAALGVVVARILEFSPGFLVGLVIGLELAARTPESRRIRAAMVQLGVIVGISLAAWLGYSVAVAAGSEPTFGNLLVQETLVAITAEGLTGALVAILPIGLLTGKEIFDRSKTLWAGSFLTIATAFSLLVLPTGLAGQEVEDLAAWTLVLLGFAAVTVGLWAVLHFTGRRAAAAPAESELVGADQR